jgi:hypothetical protein
MFQASFIFIAFVGSFVTIHALVAVDKRGWDAAAKAAAVGGLVASLYCLAAGIFLLSGWEDPFAAVDSAELGKASGRRGGRGGIIVLAIRFWPYVLIAMGSYFGYSYAAILKRLLGAPEANGGWRYKRLSCDPRWAWLQNATR